MKQHRCKGTLRGPYPSYFATVLICCLALFAQLSPAQAQQPLAESHILTTDEHRLGNVWINDVGVLLDIDRDGDGWFSRFAVSIDADINDHDDDYGFSDREARVFVRLSLTDSSEIEHLLYDSGRFDVYGRNSSDRHRIELDLREAFREDRYDMVIELRDAREDRLLDVVDADVFRSLENLPLEDAERDGRIADDGLGEDFVAVEYSGAAGPLTLLAMLLGLAARVALARRA